MNVEYVLCFMFNDDFSKVAMIRKKKPEWQAGLLNGIGGKVEPEEYPRIAMLREFEEETGYALDNNFLKHFCEMGGTDWKVHCYATRGHLEHLKTMESEPIEIIEVAGLWNERVIENIPWLVHMAIDALQDGRPHFAQVNYDRES
jgi:8-oxo-dGTP pyrophosphatase MutT (NUDIX family)